MTARDEAIQAVLASGAPVHQADIAAVINALPGDVLVRLAIERGALQQIEVDSTLDGRLNVWDTPWDGKTLLDPDTPLYRVVDK